MQRCPASHEKVVSTLATRKQGATMKKFVFSAASAILILYAISVHSVPVPANTVGLSPADAEREAWKKIKEQTAEFLAHEREYVMSQQKPVVGSTVSGQTVVAEQAVAAVNSAPVAASPDTSATTLPPVTTAASTAAPTNSSSTVAGNTADLPQTTTPATAAA